MSNLEATINYLQKTHGVKIAEIIDRINKGGAGVI